MGRAERNLMASLRNASLGTLMEIAAEPESGRARQDTDGKRASGIDPRQLYFDLLTHCPEEGAVADSGLFLMEQLDAAREYHADVPQNPQSLAAWSVDKARRVGLDYRTYLQDRRNGGPRRYFTNKAHALYFLKGVAPTKMVDGAWLYGLVAQWRDARFRGLIQTYLEELGEGVPDKNHVLLYKNLLAIHGCDQWQSLSGTHFLQGAIQLALAQHTQDFLPEVIGYNLGYEQLPLHLLITAYELNELGIDPYYFTLHVTVDNGASGHARKAIQAVFDAMPQVSDPQSFHRRMINGYKLNELGASTNSVIAGFDLDAEFHAVLTDKAPFGANLHSDHCRIGGMPVNEWLADPGRTKDFVRALVDTGWVRRNEDPARSRFWRLLEGEKAPMFGVFSAYERQVIHDWIAQDWVDDSSRTPTFRSREHMLLGRNPVNETAGMHGDTRQAAGNAVAPTDFDDDERTLKHQLKTAAGQSDGMEILARFLSPYHHHSPAGLMATRLFVQRFSLG